jgi:YHS domain-containing protein
MARPSQKPSAMKCLRALPALFLLMACDAATPTRQQGAGVATINTVTPQAAQLEPPPMLQDEAPPPKPKPLHQWHTPEPIVFTPEDEKVRAALPFTPAIAMDPIDGSKISITATTPTYEYKNKIYYFSNEANKRTFMASPEQALKGGFMRL